MERKRTLPIVLSLVAVLVMMLACGPFGGKPTITIVAPPNGTQVAVGETVEVQFRAEDGKAVVWVEMTVDDDVVATQESPVEGGQTPLEGILRWVPASAGTFSLVLTAHNAGNVDSDPAAVSIEVIGSAAGAPTTQPGQPTATTRPAQPTATTRPGQPTATTRPSQPTNTPQPTATTRPAQPTNTPQPTAVPQPEIVALLTDKDILYPGDCVTVQWTTRNATELRLNQVVVSNPAGQSVFCYGDLPLGLNTFRLTATNSAGSVFDEVAVETKPPVPTTIDAPFVPSMSGSVSADGRVLPFVSPGDDGAGINYEGFVTFDIRNLPGNANIVTALLDLGPCTVNGFPVGLGDLHVLNLQYGDLNATDYAAGGAYITSISGPCYPPIVDVTSAVEAMKAEVYFQLRIYFSSSDLDSEVDDVTYTAPTLEITYTIL